MVNITASHAKNRFGEVLNTAQHEPVQIAKNGHPFAVLLSMQEYNKIRDGYTQQQKRKQEAFDFLSKWARGEEIKIQEEALKDDPYSAHIYEKYLSPNS